MKIYHYFSLLIIAAMSLISCGADEGKSFEQAGSGTQADSLIYYYGQIKANDYWQAASYDSIRYRESSREMYLKGVKDGLELLKRGDDFYNLGLSAGLRMAQALMRMDHNFGIGFRPEECYEGFASGMRSDTSVNEAEARKIFYGIIAQLRAKAEGENVVVSKRHLREEAAMLRMKHINDQLWGSVLEPGTRELVDGEIIKAYITLTTLKGRMIDVDYPSEIKIGSPYIIPVIAQALSTMRMDGKSRFATTAMALIGDNFEQYRVEPTELVIFTIDILGPAKKGSVQKKE